MTIYALKGGRNMKITKRRKPSLLPLLILSAVVVLLTAGILPTIYARYLASANQGETAEVALFVVGGDLDRESLSIGLGDTPELMLGGIEDVTTVSLPFYVTSRSEVDVKYSVRVDFGNAPPSYLTLTLSDGASTQPVNCDGIESQFTFDDFGSINAFSGGASDPDSRVDFTLSIKVTDSDLIAGEAHLPAAKILVTVEQID